MSEIKKKVVKIKSAFSDERGEIKDIIVENIVLNITAYK